MEKENEFLLMATQLLVMFKIRKEKTKTRSIGNANFQSVVEEGKAIDESNCKNTGIPGRWKTSTIYRLLDSTFADITRKIN